VTKIKICGNTRGEDVELAVELGADLLGFIFTRSKRQVRVDEIKGVIAQVPAGGMAPDPAERMLERPADAGRLLRLVQLEAPAVVAER